MIEKYISDVLVNFTSLGNEPFVKLASKKNFDEISKEKSITLNQQRRQLEKFKFFVNAFDFLNDSQIRGDYFEFGCHKGRTFRMVLNAAAFYKIESIKFFAFDSFEGLPESGDPLIEQWKTGALSTSEDDFLKLVTSLNLYPDDIVTIKGFYENSLTNELANKIGSTKASLINVDCDYYDSAVHVFSFVEPFLQHGTVIYLDDVFAGFKSNSQGGVGQAFEEFTKKTKYKFIPHMNIGWWGRSFITANK